MGLAIKDLIEPKEILIDSLQNKILVIDTFNLLYQFLTTIRSRDGTPLQDNKGKITSHLVGLFARTTKLMEKNLKLAFVFDGEPPALKREERERRKALKAEADKRYKIAVAEKDIESMRKYAGRTVTLTSEVIEEAKALIEALGLPIIQAPSEGEAQAAYIVKKGDAYACVSQDYDSLLHGASNLVRNLSIAGKKKRMNKLSFETVKPEIIELSQVLNNLSLDQDQLIVLALLVGTDYNKGGVKGIGPKNALKLLKEHKKDFAGLFKAVKWADTQEHSWEKIFKLIKNMPCTDSYNLEWKEINTEKVEDLLCNTHDFSEERVTASLAKLLKQKEVKQQTSLEDF
ncbi:MAG: flap endonuclease-1 [Candidatus Woesearchaeota archaeon]|jgi:flap endonuclease-1|nr:flap endonuclease-1 [Candidatus Woesearchaeota archaeon]MDP7324385.1 flap endonuclease-1 [Candidatus Woesearchaeota archaeon]MDP7457437.1 flap endonuclease-1 [Candidatus Woesearchaeota archaeon]